LGADWTVTQLEDCMDAIIDYRGKTPEKTAFGIPLITAKVVKGGRIAAPTEFIAADDYEAWMRRGIPRPGDVVITTEAPLGEVAQLGAERVALAQRLIALRGKEGVLHNGFLKFLLQSENVQNQLRSRASGTTVLGIKQSELRKVLLTMPGFDEQRAIAHVLGTLDDKVELNRRMSETLETMARAMFKSWFLDFAPVRAKAANRATGLQTSLADLFSSRLVDSDLGEIPEGWRVGLFGDVVGQLREQMDPLSAPDELFHHFSIPAFDNGQHPTLEFGSHIMSQKTRVPSGVILLSKLNPEIERVWAVDVRPNESAICSTEFLVLQARPPFSRSFAYCLARSPLLRQQIESLVTGTSKSHQRAQASLVLDLAVVIPPSSVVEAFGRLTEALVARTIECRREALTLTALRNALLPKLVSGELRVRDAEPLAVAVSS
jgi:type I restriction enzyme S subunit